jgi:TolB protein
MAHHTSSRLPALLGAARLAVTLATLGAVLAAPAAAQDPQPPPGVRLGIDYGVGGKPGVLVLPVAGPAGDSVRAILMRDFDFGDRITVIGSADDPASSPVPAGGATNYPLYQRLGAAAVVQANVTATGLAVSVHDVGQRKVLRTRSFPLAAEPNSAAWRMTLHGVADELEQWITGVRGIAATQIAFSRGDDIWITHTDGAVTTRVTSGGGRAMSAVWHPSGQMLAYSLMTNAGWQIMVRNADGSGARRMSPPGLNITPTFSPDGRLLVYASGEGVGTDLYAVPVEGGSRRRLTVSQRVENVSPTFSPDGRRVAFSSNRTGRPEIWMASVDGGTPEMLTQYEFGVNNERHSPEWSPDNRRIVYHSGTQAGYQVLALSLRDGSVQQLTSDGTNSDASWAPDGRHIVFTSSRSGSQQIWIMDVESGRMRQLTRGAGAPRLAAWSGRVGGPTDDASPAAAAR